MQTYRLSSPLRCSCRLGLVDFLSYSHTVVHNIDHAHHAHTLDHVEHVSPSLSVVSPRSQHSEIEMTLQRYLCLLLGHKILL